MAEKRRTGSTSGSKNPAARSTASRSGRSATSGSRGSAGTARKGGANAARRSRSTAGYGRTTGYAAGKRRQQETSEMQRDILLVLLFAGMVFLFLSNFGLFGMVGHFFQSVMTGLLGTAAYILPVVIFALTLFVMMNDTDGVDGRVLCALIMYLVLAIVCELMSGMVDADASLDIASIWSRCSEKKSGGGVIGGFFAWALMHTVRMAGTVLVLIVISVICLVVITRKPLLRLMQESAADVRDRARYRREAEAEYRAAHPEEYEEGFLPDEEEDRLTDAEIERYRAQQAEQAKVLREERLREKARRDVERRHETKKEAVRTFRGIIGDTNLSNDPFIRRMTEEDSSQDPVELPVQEEPAAIAEELPGMMRPVDNMNSQEDDSCPIDEKASKETYVQEEEQDAERFFAQPATDEETERQTAYTQEIPAAEPEIPVSVLAAQQLLKNQRPGTDGIQLIVPAKSADTDEMIPDRDAARDAARQAIPIHRESNNLHEINALAFQGSYAALARNTVQEQEEDEDLTSRIIREGMADLTREEEKDLAGQMPGSAQSAAANAFQRSTAFTEIQDAYSRDLQPLPVNPAEEVAAATMVASEELPETDRGTAPLEVKPFEQSALEEGQAQEQSISEEYLPLEQSAPKEIRPIEQVVPEETVAVPVMREMTTPAGSGSAIAAEHARTAQIHSAGDDTRQQDSCDGAAPSAGTAATPRKETRKYVYPPLSLLTEGNPSRDSGSDEELRHTAEVLETTLHTFGVNCKITDISQGPAVTRYELLPEQGVKVSKVVGLSDDIKLALAAMDIRIEAPIPGKSAIGIEVPNKVTSTVALRDILANQNFRDHKSKLAIGIGKDISGQIVVSDLAKMPHVLIAGATGSGKSVCINTIIMSILYHATPEEVKLLMIDPKVVELSVYNGIPHLLYPVVTNPQQAATLLNWAVAEMEARYRKFADAGVRDMKGYNQMIQQQLDQGRTADEEGNTLRVMPRIVVIVDELADLMMVAKNDVETAICRLAQLARAAGIHLIIATQRPSVDVITGLIKANMPSRIAFAVSSGVDSRTILDMNGAEKLLGKGDMLFFPQGLPKPARIQGAFVTDEEVSAVVAFIKEQDPVDTEEETRVRQQMENLGSTGQPGSADSKAQDSGNDMDDYFYRAGKFIIEKNNASIGLLQRGFRIGFNRAARLMDQLCDAGIVAESEGTKSRRILMTEAEFEAYCQDNDIH